jgi:hypothetical protein
MSLSPSEHPEHSSGVLTACADCGDQGTDTRGYGDLTYWLTDDDLWDRVVGDDTIVLCPRCFTDRSSDAGISISWRAVIEEHVYLTTDPRGRH